MSEEALRAVSRHLDAAQRLRLAEVDQKIFPIATRWHDVDSLLLSEKQIVLGGPSFRHVIPSIRLNSKQPEKEKKPDSSLYDCLKLCPAARRLWIQYAMNQKELDVLAEVAPKLLKLYITVENFNTKTSNLEWKQVSLKRLQGLNILQTTTKPLSLKYRVPDCLVETLLPTSLRRVCLTGMKLSSSLLSRLLTLSRLESLDLIGSTVDSKQAAAWVKRFGEFPESLNEVSLPPSLFSFSTRTNNKNLGFTFKDLKVDKLCIYMEMFDESMFWEQAEQWFNNQLKTLIVYGNYDRLKLSNKVKHWKKFKIVFGVNQNRIARPPWSKDDVTLLNHVIRKWPYAEGAPNNGAESWRLDMETTVDSQPRLFERPDRHGQRDLGFPFRNHNNVPRAPPLPGAAARNNRRRQMAQERANAAAAARPPIAAQPIALGHRPEAPPPPANGPMIVEVESNVVPPPPRPAAIGQPQVVVPIVAEPAEEPASAGPINQHAPPIQPVSTNQSGTVNHSAPPPEVSQVAEMRNTASTDNALEGVQSLPSNLVLLNVEPLAQAQMNDVYRAVEPSSAPQATSALADATTTTTTTNTATTTVSSATTEPLVTPSDRSLENVGAQQNEEEVNAAADVIMLGMLRELIQMIDDEPAGEVTPPAELTPPRSPAAPSNPTPNQQNNSAGPNHNGQDPASRQ